MRIILKWVLLKTPLKNKKIPLKMTKIHLKNTNFFPPKQTKISPPNYKIPLEHKFRFLCDDFEFSRFKFFLDGFVFISVFFCIF